jgi:site-specific DNA recombinase
MRTAIYARFSSELQNQRSIDDQVALCREHAARRGWPITDVYADYAVSGASVHGRFSFERLVADARSGLFEQILAEDLDRLSRNQADIAGLYERMSFLGVRIHTVGDGDVSEMHIGLKGTMSALFLKTLALKIHRGMSGRVRAGKVPGGLGYGYRVGATGERIIVAEEAEVVARVFRETVHGSSPRSIAAGLNRDSIPSPRGGQWNASTINGSRKRGNGILRNEAYVGVLVWNRQRFLKDPDTGKRVTRINANDQLMRARVDELRIIDDATWQRVQSILANKGGEHASHARKSRHLFSGLMRCGACGGSYISAGGSKYPRFKCSARHESGTCDNKRMISARIIETRVLTAIEQDLLDPHAVAEAIKAYAEERRRLQASRADDERRRARRIGEIDRSINNLISLAENGADAATIGPRLRDLEAERTALRRQAAAGDAAAVTLHPSLAEHYRSLVAELRAGLAQRDHAAKAEVLTKVRALIDRIIIYPNDDPKGRDIELVGQLAALTGPAEKLSTSMGLMVAEEGLEPPTRGL